MQNIEEGLLSYIKMADRLDLEEIDLRTVRRILGQNFNLAYVSDALNRNELQAYTELMLEIDLNCLAFAIHARIFY